MQTASISTPISTPKKTKSNQYHFCIRITPKILSKTIFQTKGIQSLYKIQIFKGSKKQSSNISKRNLHQQALQGFYRSQNCYFTLSNYTNFRPYEMSIKFSEINQSLMEEHVIFIYKFSTFNFVKNFNQNGVRRTTHTVSKDLETEFYIDFYVQSNKGRLEEKVRSDSNKQILKRRHLKELPNYEQEEKDSDRMKRSASENYSPAKSSHRASSTSHYRVYGNSNLVKRLDFNNRSSTPLPKYGSNTTRRTSHQINTQNTKSQRHLQGHKYQYRNSQTINLPTQSQVVYKRFPSSRDAYIDHIKEDTKQDQKTAKNIDIRNKNSPKKENTIQQYYQNNHKYFGLNQVRDHIRHSPLSSIIILSLVLFILYLMLFISKNNINDRGVEYYEDRNDETYRSDKLYPRSNTKGLNTKSNNKKQQYKYSMKQKEVIFIYKDTIPEDQSNKQSIISKTNRIKSDIDKIKSSIDDDSKQYGVSKNRLQRQQALKDNFFENKIKKRRIKKNIVWF